MKLYHYKFYTLYRKGSFKGKPFDFISSFSLTPMRDHLVLNSVLLLWLILKSCPISDAKVRVNRCLYSVMYHGLWLYLVTSQSLFLWKLYSQQWGQSKNKH